MLSRQAGVQGLSGCVCLLIVGRKQALETIPGSSHIPRAFLAFLPSANGASGTPTIGLHTLINLHSQGHGALLKAATPMVSGAATHRRLSQSLAEHAGPHACRPSPPCCFVPEVCLKHTRACDTPNLPPPPQALRVGQDGRDSQEKDIVEQLAPARRHLSRVPLKPFGPKRARQRGAHRPRHAVAGAGAGGGDDGHEGRAAGRAVEAARQQGQRDGAWDGKCLRQGMAPRATFRYSHGGFQMLYRLQITRRRGKHDANP